MANIEPRMVGNRKLRKLRKDDLAPLRTLNDAIVGNIPAVRSKVPGPPAIEFWCSWI